MTKSAKYVIPSKEEVEVRWTKIASDALLNRKIVHVRYMTPEEQTVHRWYTRSVVIELDNGTLIYPSKDDEGNEAGALFTFNDDESKDVPGGCLPVID